MNFKHNHGFMYVIFLLSIFVIGLGWLLLSKPMEFTYNNSHNDSHLEEQIYQDFFIRTNTIWDYILVPISLMLVFAVILKVLQKNRIEGGGGY